MKKGTAHGFVQRAVSKGLFSREDWAEVRKAAMLAKLSVAEYVARLIKDSMQHHQ